MLRQLVPIVNNLQLRQPIGLFNLNISRSRYVLNQLPNPVAKPLESLMIIAKYSDGQICFGTCHELVEA